jgi:hypothetical protein
MTFGGKVGDTETKSCKLYILSGFIPSNQKTGHKSINTTMFLGKKVKKNKPNIDY